jgi:hypothetical protein
MASKSVTRRRESAAIRHENAHRAFGEGFLYVPPGRSRTREELAETLAEGFIASATAAQEMRQDTRDELMAEELGGPFVRGPRDSGFGIEHEVMRDSLATVLRVRR